MLTNEQIQEIKKQLVSQIDANFPIDKKAEAINQVQSMTPEELEEFLRQNNLIHEGKDIHTSKCIFCSIIKGETDSYKIGENKEAVAVLEINPISKGHTIIIPKKHTSVEKIPEESFRLAKDVSERIKKEFNPKKIEIQSSDLFDHGMLNVIPIYEKGNKNTERKPASEKELIESQKKLFQKEKPKESKPLEKPQAKKLEKVKIPRRIP
jgi:diadenosine tetraphosphate (Ap4A) HIT family hydrolase